MEEHHSFFGDPRTWVAIAFVIFFVVFGRTMWRALVGLLDRRTETVRAELNEAYALRREAEALLADARHRREKALAEAQELLQGAKTEARRVAEAAAVEAKASAERRERMATDRIAAAEKAAVTDVRRAAAELAAAAASRVLAEDVTAEADAPLIDHAIAALPSALARRAA